MTVDFEDDFTPMDSDLEHDTSLWTLDTDKKIINN